MKLLIFTVAGPDDASLSQDAAINIIELNPSIDIFFVIINNSGSYIKPRYPTIGNLTVVDGIPNNGQYPPSVHHAMAINNFLATINSTKYDYYLLIDPDVIQIQSNAISSIITKMNIMNASVFSFPWHLKWYSKIRSRTSPHFILFSREVLDSKILNFSPALNLKPCAIRLLHLLNDCMNFIRFQSRRSTIKTYTINTSELYGLQTSNNPLKIFMSFVISRLSINSVKDTGYQNSYKFLESHSYKTIIGKMFISPHSMWNIYHLRNKYFAWLEKKIIPNRFSFLPRMPEYIYSDKYEDIVSQFNIEIMSIDSTAASFAHMRKFTQSDTIHSVSAVKSAFNEP